MSADHPCLTAAITLLKAGYWPVPIVPPRAKHKSAGKAPIGDAWGKERHTEDSLRKAWAKNPGASVGLKLGKAGGLVDLEEDGPDGRDTLIELLGGELVETAGWPSRKGDHHVFLWDDRLALLPKSNYENDPRFPGLGLRFGSGIEAGKQLQSVCPPSPMTAKNADGSIAVGSAREWRACRTIASLPEAFFANLAAKLAEPARFEPSPPPARTNGGTSPDDRARAYINAPDYPKAVRGGNGKNSGHGQQYAAACALVDGFGLTYSQAYPILREWDLAHSQPPESDRGIEHKLRDAIARHPSPSLGILNARRNGHAPGVTNRLNGHANGTLRHDHPGDEPGVTGTPFDFGILGTDEFVAKAYPREYLIKPVMVKDRPMLLAGPRKVLKTTLLIEILISLANAHLFLGEFSVPRQIKTLLLSGESGPATIQETLRRICRAKGIDPTELEGYAYWGFKVPQFGSHEHLELLADFIREKGIEVVLIDPLYLCLGGVGKLDAANLFEVGPLLKRVSDTCLEAGATPVLAHHFRKNRESPYEPPELDDIAYSGFQEFCRQWLLLGRREKYVPGTGEHKLWITSGGSDGHGGEWAVDINEGVTDGEFRDRHWNVSIVRGTDAKVDAASQLQAERQKVADERARVKQEAKDRDDRAGMDRILDELAAAPNRKTTAGSIRTATGWRKDKVDHLLHRLLTAGVIVADEVQIVIGNGATKVFPGFRLPDGVDKC